MTKAPTDKSDRDIAAMFDQVADGYDRTRRLLWLGRTGYWGRRTARAIGAAPGRRILDVAAGTGTSSAALARRGATVVACELSPRMIAVGRRRHPDIGFVEGNAQALPFNDHDFDAVSICFGLRNIGNPGQALTEMRRVTRPGGGLVICEFSMPSGPLRRRLFSAYLRRLVPVIARWFSSNPQAYGYLAESIHTWLSPSQLAALVESAGWRRPAWRGLDGGVAVLLTAAAPFGDAGDAVPALLEELGDTDEVGGVRVLHTLLDETWADGQVFPATAALVPPLTEFLRPPVTWLHPKICLILGVFAEGTASDPAIARAVHAAVEAGLETYLRLAREPDRSVELELALLYLLAHFPRHRTRIETEWAPRHLGPDDAARLTRCLTTPDFTDPATLSQIGRVWPTPEYWHPRPGEADVDTEWRKSLRLSSAGAALIWDQETQALLAYLGAQAEHAINEVSDVR
jgi:demethylmenaquinone methyltransferase/2-methoxy-6-polyprenyl-1,4-benzoquinol methylase